MLLGVVQRMRDISEWDQSEGRRTPELRDSTLHRPYPPDVLGLRQVSRQAS